MSEVIDRRSGNSKSYGRSAIDQKEPLAHPRNCKHECPYGYGRAFCWPCMAKIMNEHRAVTKTVQEA